MEVQRVTFEMLALVFAFCVFAAIASSMIAKLRDRGYVLDKRLKRRHV